MSKVVSVSKKFVSVENSMQVHISMTLRHCTRCFDVIQTAGKTLGG